MPATHIYAILPAAILLPDTALVAHATQHSRSIIDCRPGRYCHRSGETHTYNTGWGNAKDAVMIYFYATTAIGAR